MSHREPQPETKRVRARTCVGCGVSDGALDLVRLIIAGDEVAFDLAGGAFGRGAHVHATAQCLEKAPRGLSRAFRREVRIGAGDLGSRLVEACDVRIAGLLSSARRARALAVGTDASLGALAAAEVGGPGGARRAASLLVVACDAGSIASSAEVERAARAGQAIAWATKNDLGALLGEQAVAICAVLHAAIAAEVKRVRAAADAGAELTKGRQAAFAGARPGNRGAECSRRPEAR